MMYEDLEEDLAEVLGDKFKIKIVKGELVIYTGLKKDRTGELIELHEDEDLEEIEEEEYPDEDEVIEDDEE